jgi:site-specific recombinase XerD
LEVPQRDAVQQAKEQKLSVLLWPAQVQEVLSQLDDQYRIAGNLLYGLGLRLVKCMRLHVHDIDFEMRLLVVRGGKGKQDRVTILPKAVIQPLNGYLEKMCTIHSRDIGTI